MIANWMVLCYKDNGPVEDGRNIIVKHTCVYEDEPNDNDITSLINELSTVADFGMVGDEDYDMAKFNRNTEMGQFWFKQMNIPEGII